MFDDQPGGSGQDQPQGKLILRGYNNNDAPVSPQGDTVYFPPVQSPSSPEHMQIYYPPAQTGQAPYAPPPPQSPYAQQYLPQQASYGSAAPRRSGDPIFKFLIIAIVVVVLSSVVFAAFASGVAGQIIAQHTGSRQNATNTPTTNPTQNTQGNSAANQATATVALPSPTPTLMPTATTAQQSPLQITDIDGQTPGNTSVQVSNNHTAQVSIHANQPNVRVRLIVTYNVSSGGWTDRKRTDDNGDVTLDWHVHVFNFDQNAGNITATVVAEFSDQNGQQVQSSPINVQIATDNGGGNGNGNGQNDNGNGNGQNGNGNGQN